MNILPLILMHIKCACATISPGMESVSWGYLSSALLAAAKLPGTEARALRSILTTSTGFPLLKVLMQLSVVTRLGFVNAMSLNLSNCVV